MKPCVLYARVSSEEQKKTGFSIPSQIARIEEYAAKHKLSIQASYKEVCSAKRTGRPQFEAMLRFLEEHPDVKLVLVHKLDRISRNFTDYTFLREQLGVWVMPVNEPVEDSPSGQLMQLIGMGMAKHYSLNLSQEVEKGMQAKFEAGGFNSRAPVGYRNIPRTKTKKAELVVDEERAPFVRLLFERYSTGKCSPTAIATELFDHGFRTRTGKPYSRDRICRIIKDPFYKGLTRYRGETRPGNHDAIVNGELWDRAQVVLSQRSREVGELGRKFFLLRGLLYCASCGRMLTAEDHSRGSYYRCQQYTGLKKCNEPYVPVQAFDQLVEKLLPEMMLSRKALKQILDTWCTIEHERIAEQASSRSQLAAKKMSLQSKLTKLTEGFADGTVPGEQYAALRDAWQKELESLKGRMEHLAMDMSPELKGARHCLETASSFADLYAIAGSPEDKKSLLSKVFRRIWIKEREIERIEYQSPFDLLLNETFELSSSMKDVAKEMYEQMLNQKAGKPSVP